MPPALVERDAEGLVRPAARFEHLGRRRPAAFLRPADQAAHPGRGGAIDAGDGVRVDTKLDGQAGAGDDAVTHGELASEYRIWREHNPTATQAPTPAELWEIRYRSTDEYRQYVYERQLRSDNDQDPSLAPVPVDLQAIAPGIYRFRARRTWEVNECKTEAPLDDANSEFAAICVN